MYVPDIYKPVDTCSLYSFCTVGFALFCDFPIYTTVCIQSIRYIFIYLAKFLFSKTHRDLKNLYLHMKICKNLPYTVYIKEQLPKRTFWWCGFSSRGRYNTVYTVLCMRVKWFLRKHIWNIFTSNPKNTLVQHVFCFFFRPASKVKVYICQLLIQYNFIFLHFPIQKREREGERERKRHQPVDIMWDEDGVLADSYRV